MTTDESQWRCQWDFCDRSTFANRGEFLRHLKRHCAQAAPVVRAVYESQDSNGSASYRPPRFDSLGVEGLNESKVNGSGTSFANTSSPVRAEALKAQEPQRLDDELPPPTLSAPPASIPFVASQNEPVITVSAGSATDAETSGKIDNDSAGSNMAVFGTVPEEKNPLFQFGFSQMPGVLQSSTGEAGDTSMSQANNSDEQQFALNFSQMVDTQAMTQA